MIIKIGLIVDRKVIDCMSLFGLFYTMFGVGCKGAINIKNAIEDSDHRTRHRDSETNTYFDHNMNRRDLSTNHIMEIEKDYYGDVWLKDLQTGRYVQNITAGRVETNYQKEKTKASRGESDRTHIKYGDNEHRKDEFSGIRYKDFKTGKLYVERSMIFTEEHYKMLHLWSSYGICQRDFSVLFSPETKKIVRLTDGTIEQMLGQGALIEDINKFFHKYVKEYYEHMAEPYSTWYKQKLYYETTLRPCADSLKDKFIEKGEARVKYRRSEK